jgi:hypothetical protein
VQWTSHFLALTKTLKPEGKTGAGLEAAHCSGTATAHRTLCNEKLTVIQLWARVGTPDGMLHRKTKAREARCNAATSMLRCNILLRGTQRADREPLH